MFLFETEIRLDIDPFLLGPLYTQSVWLLFILQFLNVANPDHMWIIVDRFRKAKHRPFVESCVWGPNGEAL